MIISEAILHPNSLLKNESEEAPVARRGYSSQDKRDDSRVKTRKPGKNPRIGRFEQGLWRRSIDGTYGSIVEAFASPRYTTTCPDLLRNLRLIFKIELELACVLL